MKFTETGEQVYKRTYSRLKPNGQRETWPETVERVVDGNLSLVDSRHHLPNERQQLIDKITRMDILPAGRHLWASGTGTGYLFNCFVSGYTENIEDHFRFTFLRLMEGGGVGSNYSEYLVDRYEPLTGPYRVHFVCDPNHADYDALRPFLSTKFVSDWEGAYVVEDSREGWADALCDLLQTYQRSAKHTDRVYDISNIRPEGAPLRTFGGFASGPLPLAKMLKHTTEELNSQTRLTGMSAMRIDHFIGQCVVSGGIRRSARMSLMHWNDPHIDEFINCKRDTELHWTTNISVALDESFFEQYEKVQLDFLEKVASRMVYNGEPGLWNQAYSNEGEPVRVEMCNPCGELALQDFEPCNLGHVNLAAHVDTTGRVRISDIFNSHTLITRFLIRATFAPVGSEISREVLDRNRRIGVGHLGLGSFLALTGRRYEASNYLEGWLGDWYHEVRQTALEYAHELRIPAPVKMTTVAPTGTISKLSGVTEGMQPAFARWFIRRIRFSTVDPHQVAQVARYRELGYDVETALDAENTVVVSIPTEDLLMQQTAEIYGEKTAESIVDSVDTVSVPGMLEMQRLYQEFWADNCISTTINLPSTGTSSHSLANALLLAIPNLKGVTVFPETSIAQPPYTRISKQEYDQFSVTETADSVDEECATGACPVR